MNQFNTLMDALCAHAAEQPDRRILTYLESFGARETHFTFGELDQQARAIAAHLKTSAQPGERAILLYPLGMDIVPAFFGALYAGLIPVPVIPPRPNQPPTTIVRILADADAKLILTNNVILSGAQGFFGGSGSASQLQWVATDSLAAQTPPPEFTPMTGKPEDVAVLLYTSGSTSLPKGVMLTHANIISQMRIANEMLKPDMDESLVTWVPLHHGGGLIGAVVSPIYNNAPATILSPLEVLERPGYWLQVVSQTHATVTTGANFLYQWCIDRTTPAVREGLDLTRLKGTYCGAEPVRRDTLEHFAEMFAPYGFRVDTFRPAYGQTETTVLTTLVLGGIPSALKVSRQALEQGKVVQVAAEEEGQTFVDCGAPIYETTIQIVEPVTRVVCAPDRVGEIWVAGPTVAPGYWNNPTATQEVFHAYIADSGAGPFLRTGDLGFLRDGHLYVAGRLKDLIIVRGKNYYAQDVEAAVATAHPALQAGGSAAFGVELDKTEAIVLMHEVKPNAGDVDIDEIAAAIRATAATTLDLPLYAVVIVAANSLPRTPTGKIQRFLCRQEFLAAQKNR